MIYGLSLRLFKVPDVPVIYIVVTDGLGDGDSRVGGYNYLVTPLQSLCNGAIEA